MESLNVTQQTEVFTTVIRLKNKKKMEAKRKKSTQILEV